MPQPEPTSNPRIELDLGEPGLGKNSFPRHSRQVSQETMAPLPKIEPIVKNSDVGSDEAERTVAIFFLLSAVPTLVSVLLGHGAGGIISLAIPVYLGIRLLRGDDFVKQWIVAACFVQIIIGPISALVSPRSIVFILGGVAQSVGLLVLVSGRALSKQIYGICLGIVGLGILTGLIGSFIH